MQLTANRVTEDTDLQVTTQQQKQQWCDPLLEETTKVSQHGTWVPFVGKVVDKAFLYEFPVYHLIG